MSKDLGPPRRGFVADALKAAQGQNERSAPAFFVNRQSAVPLHVQIKEQIRYAVTSGDLEPGVALPSIRELTAQLGVHRNTVHRVYMELQALGVLVSRPGVGVFVNDALSRSVSPSDLAAVDELVERFFVEGRQAGINPVTLSRLVSQRAPAHDARHPTVAFVECTAHQSVECARDLGESFGVRVVHLLLDDLRRQPCRVPGDLRHVVTSLFHYDEVSEWAEDQGRKVHAVTYGLHPATQRQLRQIGPDVRLGFVCHDANTEEVIGKQVAARVPDGVFVGCANLESKPSALELLGNVDTVILTEPAAAFCIEHCTPDHELLELHFSLHPASVEKVRRAVLFEV
ncbi:MAG: GntR family transcriptional regulator [Myxococcota bacterium]